MRKLSIAAIAAIAVLAFGGVAYAANLYGLPIASTSPKGVGSPSKPFPTGVKFGYTVKDENGPRGAPVEGYKIAFQGLTTKYAKNFPKCKFSDTAPDAPLSTIEAKCKKAKVGSGRIESLVTTDAAASDPEQRRLLLQPAADALQPRLRHGDPPRRGQHHPADQPGPVRSAASCRRTARSRRSSRT